MIPATIHFISDLHLSPQSPGATRLFLAYLNGPARSAQSLYVLGDLFEAWPGDDSLDDSDDTYHRSIVEALRVLGDAGVSLFVQHGNRDFLLGDRFAQRCAARLLPDPYVLTLPEWQFVLAHGDHLCTDDTEYQDFRRQVRAPTWQAAFLSKPLAARKAIAATLRQQSEDAKRGKLESARAYLMDVNPAATDDFLRAHGYATFVHGHTHRPATHDHLVDGIHVERWVLADWHETQGEYLAWDGQRLTRHAVI